MCDKSAVAKVEQVEIAPLHPERYEEVMAPTQVAEFQRDRKLAKALFNGRTVWNVNSTAAGGGVAEMLRSLIAYARGADVDCRWVVIEGTPDFFTITKRLHNNLHDFAGDGGPLGDWERRQYEEALAQSCDEFCRMVGPRDIVLLHDPQTAGLIPRLKAAGVPVIWRCHVGIDNPTDLVRTAWNFLRPYVLEADAYVFSRKSFVWDGLEPAKTNLIMPSIDAFSSKNRELDDDAIRAILVGAGLVAGSESADAARYVREDGSEAAIENRATLYETAPLQMNDRTVLQVSRWDTLKDPLGVITGFAEHVVPHSDAHLVYAGPAVEAVSDDPEGKKVLEDAINAWKALPDEQRARIHLATLPMVDGEENAAMVNALQRHAYAVVQKSTAEGFGLTVAEAMWKARPVVASSIGGIQDQIEDGKTGILLQDPADLQVYGRAVVALLDDRQWAEGIGKAAQERVRDEFLGARSLIQYMKLMGSLIEA
jgi:trehalose synthase